MESSMYGMIQKIFGRMLETYRVQKEILATRERLAHKAKLDLLVHGAKKVRLARKVLLDQLVKMVHPQVTLGLEQY